MVAAAAGHHRGLLQRPQARRRLAGLEDAGTGPRDRLDKRAVSVAMPERCPSKLSAVRSAASRPAADPLASTPPPAPPPPLPLDDQIVDVLDPALAHRLGDAGQPEDDARLLLHDPRPAPALPRARSPPT